MTTARRVLPAFTALPALFTVVSLALCILCSACRTTTAEKFARFPRLTLWAWERPENLDFIDKQKFGVAFLAQTLELSASDVTAVNRHQPLKVAAGTSLIAVTRIETSKRSDSATALSDLQREQVVGYVLKSIELKDVAAIQIDFDATVSERDFYRNILTDLRQKLPSGIPISITALASFCIDDGWVKDLPVDEIVPMIFRMGADDRKIKDYLTQGGDFRGDRCQTSYGVAADEPIETKFAGSRRIYFFNIRSWTRESVEALDRPQKTN